MKLPEILLIGLALSFAPIATAVPLYFTDSSMLRIRAFSDPSYPEPEIGARAISATFLPKPEWSAFRVRLQITTSLSPMELPPYDDGSRASSLRDVILTSEGSGFFSANGTVPWRKPVRNGTCTSLTPAERGADFIKDNGTGYYRWIVNYTEGGIAKEQIGDIHTFTAPRRLVFVNIGDSYGAGLGAPCAGPLPWLDNDFDARRSALSGQELAIAEFGMNNPDTAYDYTNEAVSGAIASDVIASQADKVANWMRLNRYKTIDTVILSIGGNDMGFSALVKRYLGLDVNPGAGLKACASDFLDNLVRRPFRANYMLVECIVDELLTRFVNLGDNATYKYPYRAEDVSETTARNFAWYENRLRTSYIQLAQKIDGGLDLGGGQTASVNQVLATEYPIALKGCESFTDEIGLADYFGSDVLVFDPLQYVAASTSGIFRNPPVLTVDLTAYRVRPSISRTETTEILTELALPVSRPRVTSGGAPVGGLNHVVRQAMIDATSGLPSEWTFVATDPFLNQTDGLCWPSRKFVRLKDAASFPSPDFMKRLANAFHPNADGHRSIYRPAISAPLGSKMNGAYRIAQAAREGLKATTVPEPDLSFSRSVPITSRLVRLTLPGASPRFFADVTVGIENIGNARSAQTEVRASIAGFGNPITGGVTRPLRQVDPDGTETVGISFLVPVPAPLTGEIPYKCHGFPFAGFDQFADTDRALATLTSFAAFDILVEIDPAGQVGELNTATTSTPWWTRISASGHNPPTRWKETGSTGCSTSSRRGPGPVPRNCRRMFSPTRSFSRTSDSLVRSWMPVSIWAKFSRTTSSAPSTCAMPQDFRAEAAGSTSADCRPRLSCGTACAPSAWFLPSVVSLPPRATTAWLSTRPTGCSGKSGTTSASSTHFPRTDARWRPP